jgi:hypothetical protein
MYELLLSDLYIDPLPVPEPAVEMTLIDTTDGVTKDAMLFTSIVGAPSVIGVLVDEHPELAARKIAWLFLSTQTLTPSGSVVAAVATPPARVAPKRKPAMIFVDVLFISTSFLGKNKFSLLPERKFRNALFIVAT